MSAETGRIRDFLSVRHPFDLLEPRELDRVAGTAHLRHHSRGAGIYAFGEPLEGLYLVLSGRVEITDADGAPISRLGSGGAFGERGLLRDGLAVTNAVALQPTETVILPRAEFDRLRAGETSFRVFFEPGFRHSLETGPEPRALGDLTRTRLVDMMTRDPLAVAPDLTVAEAARLMSERGISCLLVVQDDRLAGIVTTRDLTGRVLARGLSGNTAVAEVMTPDPMTLEPQALALDALMLMTRNRVAHLPVAAGGRAVGIVTHTDLVRCQSVSATLMLRDIAGRDSVAGLAEVVRGVPRLLAQLIGAGARAEAVGRVITAVSDAVTCRLLDLAEAEFGPAPVPWLWAACGSQGRREQSGVSDQDNCLILSDDLKPEHEPYFAALAERVSTGLDACGYTFCPGEMMATNPRWRQPVRVWRGYFQGWIDNPDPMAQMLASVMFDLRPIAGDASLFDGLQAETLSRARANGIFVAHMVSNALKHTPPLGLLRGLSLIRSGEHRNRIDLKLNGVVPVVDLARIYALRREITAVNTRERLVEAREAGEISAAGAHDLIDAYDLISELRLGHQAARVRAGEPPDNFLDPATLSDLERSHLRDAFVAVRTMQSALGQSHYMMR